MIKFIKRLEQNKFYILHFTFYIIFIPILLNIIGCTSPTEKTKGKLSGIVHLENQEDHSGIIIALYELVTLDTTIVRINNQYPHIGIKITQHTEFDHRLQSPLYTVETDASGSFEIKDIPTGTYNLVAIKDGWGFRYITDFDISKGENYLTDKGKSETENEKSSISPSLTREIPKDDFTRFTSHISQSEAHNSKLLNRSDITLYEEQHFSGVIQQDWVFETDHHYIIDEDTEFHPNFALTIQPGAIIRINPGKDFTINGSLTAQGEENNMFWITSNHGFEENAELLMFNSQLNSKLPNRSREIELYNSMELSPYVTITDDLIEWGKWDWGNTGLLNYLGNKTISYSIFRNNQIGFFSSTLDSTFCENSLFINNSQIGIYYLNNLSGKIGKNVLTNNECGCEIKNGFCGIVENNYFYGNEIGCFVWSYHGDIIHNEFAKNYYDIKLIGNNDLIQKDVIIRYNNFIQSTAVWQTSPLSSYGYMSNLFINYNNFINNNFFIYYLSYSLTQPIDATNNYFNSLTNTSEIYNYIHDTWPNDPDVHYDMIEIEPFSQNIISQAGIL